MLEQIGSGEGLGGAEGEGGAVRMVGVGGGGRGEHRGEDTAREIIIAAIIAVIASDQAVVVSELLAFVALIFLSGFQIKAEAACRRK